MVCPVGPSLILSSREPATRPASPPDRSASEDNGGRRGRRCPAPKPAGRRGRQRARPCDITVVAGIGFEPTWAELTVSQPARSCMRGVRRFLRGDPGHVGIESQTDPADPDEGGSGVADVLGRRHAIAE
jgi:hypothetical protein